MSWLISFHTAMLLVWSGPPRPVEFPAWWSSDTASATLGTLVISDWRCSAAAVGCRRLGPGAGSKPFTDWLSSSCRALMNGRLIGGRELAILRISCVVVVLGWPPADWESVLDWDLWDLRSGESKFEVADEWLLSLSLRLIPNSDELLAPLADTPLVPAETPLVPAKTWLVLTETPLVPAEMPLVPAETPLVPAETPLVPAETPLVPNKALLIPDKVSLVPFVVVVFLNSSKEPLEHAELLGMDGVDKPVESLVNDCEFTVSWLAVCRLSDCSLHVCWLSDCSLHACCVFPCWPIAWASKAAPNMPAPWAVRERDSAHLVEVNGTSLFDSCLVSAWVWLSLSADTELASGVCSGRELVPRSPVCI